MSSDNRESEKKVVARLWDVLVICLNRRLKEPLSRQDMDESKAERLVTRTFLLEHVHATECLLAGVVGVFVFRKARFAVANQWWRRRSVQNTNSTTTTTTSTTLDQTIKPGQTTFQQSSIQSPFRNSNKIETDAPLPRPSWVLSMIGWLVDLYVGSLVASAVLKYYYAPETVNAGLALMAKIPLVEGRSLLSDAVCDDVTEELKKNSHVVQQHTVDDPSLKHFMDLVANCSRRRAYEHLLRQEQGLAADARVLVPPPGVPSDFMASDSIEADSQFWNAEKFYSDDQNSSWASSLTTDQQRK